jgi:hypothetical protein
MISDSERNYVPDPDPINDPFAHFCDRCEDLDEGEEFCDSLSLTRRRDNGEKTAVTGGF